MRKILATVLVLPCVPAALAAEPNPPPLMRGEALEMLLLTEQAGPFFT